MRQPRPAPSLFLKAPVGTDLELLDDEPDVTADMDQGQPHAAQDVADPGGGTPDTAQGGEAVTRAVVNNDHCEPPAVSRYPRRTRSQPDRYCPISKH